MTPLLTARAVFWLVVLLGVVPAVAIAFFGLLALFGWRAVRRRRDRG